MTEKCDLCGKERNYETDTLNYHPLQVLQGQPLGWYNGEDGSVCGDCMTKQIRNQ